MGPSSHPWLFQPRRGGSGSRARSVAPSGAVNINATFRPTAHAVGYFLAPLRGFRSPGALSKRLWGEAPPPEVLRPDGLEVELETHLNLTRRIHLAGDLAEVTVSESSLDAAKDRVVECIKSFRPDLQSRALSHLT